MHELHAAQRMLDIALRSAKRQAAERITSIRVSVSRLSHLNPDSLRFCFEVVSRDTIAQGARLEVTLGEAATACPRCLATPEPGDADLFCPNCGEPKEWLRLAPDLGVESLEIEF